MTDEMERTAPAMERTAPAMERTVPGVRADEVLRRIHALVDPVSTELARAVDGDTAAAERAVLLAWAAGIVDHGLNDERLVLAAHLLRSLRLLGSDRWRAIG